MTDSSLAHSLLTSALCISAVFAVDGVVSEGSSAWVTSVSLSLWGSQKCLLHLVVPDGQSWVWPHHKPFLQLIPVPPSLNMLGKRMKGRRTNMEGGQERGPGWSGRLGPERTMWQWWLPWLPSVGSQRGLAEEAKVPGSDSWYGRQPCYSPSCSSHGKLHGKSFGKKTLNKVVMLTLPLLLEFSDYKTKFIEVGFFFFGAFVSLGCIYFVCLWDNLVPSVALNWLAGWFMCAACKRESPFTVLEKQLKAAIIVVIIIANTYSAYFKPGEGAMIWT